MEHWEALCPGGYRFVYDDALFRPGTDTFLLSSLPRLKPGLRVCDLGCGTGLLGLLLLQRQPKLSVTGMDIQPAAIRLAEKAAAENDLTDRLTFCTADLRDVKSLFPTGCQAGASRGSSPAEANRCRVVYSHHRSFAKIPGGHDPGCRLIGRSCRRFP